MRAGWLFGILLTLLIEFKASAVEAKPANYSIDFFGTAFNFEVDSSIIQPVASTISEKAITEFYEKVNAGNYKNIVSSLLAFKEKNKFNDWIYYQLIRKTAQQISPKAENYERYTLYKWFFLTKSGYDAKLVLGQNHLFFYVKSNDDITDIPFFRSDEGDQYVCLNIHDYKQIDIAKELLTPVKINVPEARKSFSYKVTRLPDFKPEDYSEKTIEFNYQHRTYHFQVKLTSDIQSIFLNYPGVDFESYFNIPLSKETYSSLIPLLKKNVEKMSQRKGVDYLMRFTRYAFLYERDEDNFGKEKRLSPEQTLFNEKSDCDDRVALFFYLVKEIYNLPMIALLYPSHITMAVQFDKPVGTPIQYNGRMYSVCEPTPQLKDLKIGQVASNLKDKAYEVVYVYEP